MCLAVFLSMIDGQFGRQYVSARPKQDNLPEVVRSKMEYNRFDPEVWREYQNSLT